MTRSIPVFGLLLVALGSAAGCASTPEPVPLPTGISITPLEEGSLYGGRAVYGIKAPPSVVSEVLLDFGAYPEFREVIVGAEVVATSAGGGEVILTMRGGPVDPSARCRYTVEKEDGVETIRYEMTERTVVLWGLRGSFRLVPAVEGGTLVTQEFLLSAIVMDREALLRDLRTDAESIRERAEARRGS